MPLANKFPPKFSQNILYPAIYNLDEYDMPQSDYPLGTYFDVHFPNFGINITPSLAYGKHKFDINIKSIAQEYNVQGYPIGSSLPKLKNGSRILFELKDAADASGKRRVIFSDYTPIIKSDGFTNYIWLKEDPLRTYEDINPGWGMLTLVGKSQTSNALWRNKYNVRSQLPVYIDVSDSNNSAWDNQSPILFQATTSSLGSGSGLAISEVRTFEDPSVGICNINISSSRLRTYSGEVSIIRTYMKISGSLDMGTSTEWFWVADHELTSSNYEDGIYEDYGRGINTLSEEWSHVISTDIIYQWGSGTEYNRVKFKLEFRDPMNMTAKDYYTDANVQPDYVLEYPNVSDTDIDNGWVDFLGGTYMVPMSTTNPNLEDDTLAATTGAGKYTYDPDFQSSVQPEGGQLFDTTTRKPQAFNHGGGVNKDCRKTKFGCGDKPSK